MRVSQTGLAVARLGAAARDDDQVKLKGVKLSHALQEFQGALMDRGWDSADVMEATANVLSAATTKLRRERGV